MNLALRMRILIGAALLVVSCDNAPTAVGDHVAGRYYLSSSAFSPGAGRTICYLRQNGACDLRVPPSVALIGVSGDFISAGVTAPGDPQTIHYYYIVREFDGPFADLKRTVRGPFNEAAFLAERRKHGVPGVAKILEL